MNPYEQRKTMEAIIWFAGLALISSIVASIHYRREYVRLKAEHKMLVREAWRTGHQDGWNDALKDRRAVRRAADNMNFLIR